MYSHEMYKLGSNRSVIRELFEFGLKRSAEIGKENVFDFSLGNPNVPAPSCVKQAIIDCLNENELVHGYTSAQGDLSVRKTIANSINRRFGTTITCDNLYMTVGAAASLCICLRALNTGNNEFITFAPFFPEYTVFTQSAGGKLVVIPAKENDFQIDFDKFINAINANTKAVIINSPNNPSGVVYSEQTIARLCQVLTEKSKEYNHPIFLISDEPYREIVYDDVNVPYLLNYYPNTFVCYSYSKSLSLPGERIGYIVVSNKMENNRNIYYAICGAGRALGYVCAPSLFQKVIEKCVDATSDITTYKTNRDLLYSGLTELGFECVKPNGAFYMFVKAMESDANAFCEKAKQFDLLIVPSDDFGVKGYARIAYCVTTQQIKNAMPAFAKLANAYKK
ncbi:MAG: pyridoxal phosphate-dependent aminotransferase [Clostridia bacterium]